LAKSDVGYMQYWRAVHFNILPLERNICLVFSAYFIKTTAN